MKPQPIVIRPDPRWKFWKPWFATMPVAMREQIIEDPDGMAHMEVTVTPGPMRKAYTRRGALRKARLWGSAR